MNLVVDLQEEKAVEGNNGVIIEKFYSRQIDKCLRRIYTLGMVVETEFSDFNYLLT